MKRTSKHIKKTLAYIQKAWLKCPDLRLAQLLTSLNPSNNPDTFYVEDEVFVTECKKLIRLGAFPYFDNRDLD